MSLFGKKFKVDYCGEKFAYKNAKDEYRAGEKVTVYYWMIATDTDYSFWLEGGLIIWLKDRKTEPNCSEIPNNCEVKICDTCRNKGFEGCEQPCLGCGCCDLYEPKDEPQTEEEYINNLPWTEVGNGEQTDDAYFLELMGAVERGEISDAGANQAWYEYINHKDEPQTERSDE